MVQLTHLTITVSLPTPFVEADPLLLPNNDGGRISYDEAVHDDTDVHAWRWVGPSPVTVDSTQADHPRPSARDVHQNGTTRPTGNVPIKLTKPSSVTKPLPSSGARRAIMVDLPHAPRSSTTPTIANLNLRSVGALVDFMVSGVLFVPMVLISRHWWGLDSLLNPATFDGDASMIDVVSSMVYLLLVLGWALVGMAVFSALPMISLGNRWLGMAVVDASTFKAPSVMQMVRRAATALVDNVFLMSLGSLLMLFDARRQGLRDKVAHTIVVIDRQRARFP